MVDYGNKVMHVVSKDTHIGCGIRAVGIKGPNVC